MELQARLRKAIFESVILAGSDFHRSKQLATGCAVTQFSSGGSLRLANDYFLNYQLLVLYFFVILFIPPHRCAAPPSHVSASPPHYTSTGAGAASACAM